MNPIELEEARSRLLQTLTPLPTEEIAVIDALNRVCAEPVEARSALPPFDNSSVDGYAVQSGSLATASSSQPVFLRVSSHTAAGRLPPALVQADACARIFTGSALPERADAVLMQEDIESVSTPDGAPAIRVTTPVKPWENVRLMGEDVRSGEEVLPRGVVLRAGHLALARGVGVSRIRVHRRPRVSILCSGDELVDPVDVPVLPPGCIYETNRNLIALGVSQAGCDLRLCPLVPDRLDPTIQALALAAEGSDVLITTGGASVGDHDYLRAGLEAAGGRIEFWRVAMKPGKPFFTGMLGGCRVFGLPGNPVSALVTFVLLVRPALLRLQGALRTDLEVVRSVLAEPLVNRGGRRHFMRVGFDADGRVCSAGLQASHGLSALPSARGLVDVAPGTRLEAGSEVPVHLLP